MNAQFHPSLARRWRHTGGLRLYLHPIILILLALHLPLTCAYGFDLARELDITTNLVAHPGDAVVELDVGRTTTVFALHRKATPSKAKGTIILFHDFGLHADYPNPIRDIRKELPKAGWSTLSVETPQPELEWRDLPLDDLLEEVRLRLTAAITFLASEGAAPIAVLGQGYTATVLLNLLTSTPPENIRAFIALSLPQINPPVPWGDSAQLLQRMAIPTLDIYAESDSAEVLNSIDERYKGAKMAAKLIERNPYLRYSPKVQSLTAQKKENVWYRQVRIANADHFFSNKPAATSKAIWGWLDVFIEKGSQKRD